ncbi:hypothetical protein NQ317_017364 [Molorchus minor]|uniref:Uncharacterized protein n=1 Tax=Molorchus minor TaxID=1323400 RepID=A0ABQ9J8M1_9CUCU|nr:hypothetical protein NQ317_017364 [Molorchus minor]
MTMDFSELWPRIDFRTYKNDHEMKMLRYSEIPRDVSADSLSTFKLTESQDDTEYKLCSSRDSEPLNDSIPSHSFDTKSRKISSPSISSGPGPPTT